MRSLLLCTLLAIFVLSSCSKSPRDSIIGTWQSTETKTEIAILQDGRCMLASGIYEWSLSNGAPYTFTVGDTVMRASLDVIDENTIRLDEQEYRKLEYMDYIQEYFPTTENSKWEYDASLETGTRSITFKMTSRITDSYIVQGQKIYRLASVYDNPDFENTSSYSRMDDSGIYEQSQTDSLEFEKLTMPFPLVYGYEWKTTGEDADTEYKFLGTTILDFADVSYKDVLVVSATSTMKNGIVFESSSYYVRGIGMFKAVVNYKDLDAKGEMILTDYTI